MKANTDWQAIAREEIRFFGDVSAGISHEINNRLAVINEKAGLLQDLAAMLAHGKDVDPVRFEEQSKKIVEQVTLAREVVRGLNRFAHSADEELAEVEVTELLGLVAALYARKAKTAEAELLVSDAGEPVTVRTNPFMLESLIGRGFEFALARVGGARTVYAAVENANRGFTVAFSGLSSLTGPSDLPGSNQDGVSEILGFFGASYRVEPDGTALHLDVPYPEGLSHGRTA
ncbi:MAG: hypothetical protein LJE93_03785 [Acidobacteria bacterium]|jgi:hypothetical protein|nr:hypothetical protein [Acidobacteriota bacterium]